ncbi:MAG: AAA family ATPase, partial [Lachnospiraceae bacterium]|nr:AAA family ATPase [Lachnospiraceae bacterium]
MQPRNDRFRNIKDELNAWMAFVDELCRLMIISGESEEYRMTGMVGRKPAVDRMAQVLLEDTPSAAPLYPYLMDDYEALMGSGDVTSEGIAYPVWNLFRSPAFTDAERMALIIALSVDLNRKYEQIYDYLSGDASGSGRPTIGLILDMCRLFLPVADVPVTELIRDDGLFMQLLADRIPYHGSLMGTEIRLRRPVLSLLMGHEDEMNRSDGAVGYLVPAGTGERMISAQAYDDLRSIYASGEHVLVYLKAPRGTGKRFLVERLADEVAPGVISLDVPALIGMKEDSVREILEEIALKHLLFGDIIYLDAEETDRIDAGRLKKILSILGQFVFRIFIGGDGSLPDDIGADRLKFVITLNAPDRNHQKILWEDLAVRYGVTYADDVDLDVLVSKFNITPGNIERTLKCCATLYGSGVDDPPGAEAGTILHRDAIEEQLRSLSGEKLGTLARKLSASFGLNDIQLREDTLATVDQVLNRIRHRSTVNDTYGFAAKLPYGRGVSVVLYGPPGTGKTMLACVMAHELGLDLYRVDTSEIGSKYIGETEKNLSALFDAAKGSNGILFFDEADALFAKRTDVESSNDKHANSEVAFLLQQIEEYDGLSILATNAVHNFDAAFKRRMTYMISVDRPDEEERLLLWRHVFPEATPLAKDVNFELYARVDGMTGSSIKAAAVSAAYFAASEGRAVTNADIIEAIDAEYRKAGNMS